MRCGDRAYFRSTIWKMPTPAETAAAFWPAVSESLLKKAAPAFARASSVPSLVMTSSDHPPGASPAAHSLVFAGHKWVGRLTITLHGGGSRAVFRARLTMTGVALSRQAGITTRPVWSAVVTGLERVILGRRRRVAPPLRLTPSAP